MFKAQGGDGPGSHQRQRQTNAKAQHQRGAQENFFSCKQISSTVMDAGQGSAPGQAKQHDLPCRHLAAIKAPVDLLSMSPLMRVLPLLRHQRRGG